MTPLQKSKKGTPKFSGSLSSAKAPPTMSIFDRQWQ
jgi:hypothetical protein